MSDVKMKKGGYHGLSPQMALLNLRWQQIRKELLQEVSFAPAPPRHSSNLPVLTKKEFALAQ